MGHLLAGQSAGPPYTVDLGAMKPPALMSPEERVTHAEIQLANARAAAKEARKLRKRKKRDNRKREKQIARATGALEALTDGEGIDEHAQVEAARLLLQVNGVIA